MTRSSLITAALIAALWSAAPPARSSIDDFKEMGKIAAGTNVAAVATSTGGDRYVVVLDQAANKLKFLDTWVFGMVSGASVGLGTGTALSLAVSPYGDYAFVGKDNGSLVVVDLSPLDGLTPFQSPAAFSSVETVTISSGNPLESLAVVPDTTGATTDIFILCGVPSISRLYWLVQHDDGSRSSTDVFNLVIDVLDLEGGALAAFDVHEESALTWLGSYQCSSQRCDVGGTGGKVQIDNGTGNFRSLGIDREADAYAMVGDTIGGRAYLYKTTLLDAMALTGNTAASLTPLDLAVLPSGAMSNAYAAAVGGGTGLELFEINDTTVTLANTAPRTMTLSGAVTLDSLAASSGQDSYLYAAGGTGVWPVTANPIIDGLTVVTAQPVTGDTVTLEFSILSGASAGVSFDYSAHKGGTFGQWGTALKSGTTTQVGSTVTLSFNSSSLDECDNVITVLAQRQNNTGRNAVTVNRDLAPPKQSFGVEFADKKLIVNFTARDLCDLERYDIFYGSTLVAGDSLSALAGLSVIAINNPAAGDKISENISGLSNGTKYYVYVVTYDQTGHHSVSGPQSGTPQPVQTLTDVAGEKGGVDCLGSLAGRRTGDPWSAALLLLPVLIGLGYRTWRRCRT